MTVASARRALGGARPGVAPLLCGAALGVAAIFDASAAAAADYEVQSDTAFQAYDVANPWGDASLLRRRLMQTLQLGVYDIQGDHRPGEADYSVVVRLRLDADYGLNAHLGGALAGAETDYSVGGGARYVPGLDEAPLDIMYGWVEGRNLANGWLGFRIGRQYLTDVLGWWSFDGGLVRLTTPFYVRAEVYGGLEQRGGLPLSTSRYEAQGVWRGSHAGFGGAGQPSVVDYPSYQYAQPAPAFGFAVESVGPSWIHGKFVYRHVYDTGGSITTQFADPAGGYHLVRGTRTSQERLGYAAEITRSTLGGVKGGFSYDLYNQRFGSYYAGVEGYLGQRVTLGADLDYYVPTFDGDSIWNWFSHGPITTITGRTAIRLSRRADLAASGGARLWVTDGDPYSFGQGEIAACQAAGLADCTFFDPSNPKSGVAAYEQAAENRATTTTTDAIADLSGRYRFGSGDVGVRGMLEAGARGRRTGGDVYGEKRLDGERYAVGARVSLFDWADPTRPDRDATSFGYVLGFGYRPADVASFHLEWEHDMNRLVGQRFRVLATLALRVMR